MPRFAIPTIGLVSALICAGACTRNVKLVVPDTSPLTGTTYICDSSGCKDNTAVDPAATNPPNTALIKLPRECGGLISELLILDSGSGSPSVVVTCAPPESIGAPIGEPIGPVDSTTATDDAGSEVP